MILIVGLGNPGREYEKTRHNVGFMAIDNFAKRNNINIDSKKFNGLYKEIIINNKKAIILKPLSFMNLSGEVIKKFVDYYKIKNENILVINDDLDIELGKFKLKPKGSCGGHNGLRNIEHQLKTKDYKRLKIGISKNFGIDTKEYVLENFKGSEFDLLNPIIDLTNDIINDFFYLDFENLMNKYNHK